jgi:hypothetical protein
MALKRPRENIEQIAASVAESLEALIEVMQEAAYQISRGRSLEEIPVGGYRLYLVKTDPEEGQSHEEAIICTMDLEDYMSLLEKRAAEMGLRLDAASELEVAMPEAEFGEDMITGGFGNFKGVSVELRNCCLEELIEAVCSLLKARGLAVACAPDEDVIFYLPLTRRV